MKKTEKEVKDELIQHINALVTIGAMAGGIGPAISDINALGSQWGVHLSLTPDAELVISFDRTSLDVSIAYIECRGEGLDNLVTITDKTKTIEERLEKAHVLAGEFSKQMRDLLEEPEVEGESGPKIEAE